MTLTREEFLAALQRFFLLLAAPADQRHYNI